MNAPPDRYSELQARLLGVEERMQDLGQRLDNGIRNLVALAQAARQLTSRIEEISARVDTLAGSMAASNSVAEAAAARGDALDARLTTLEEQQFAGGVDLTSMEQRLSSLERVERAAVPQPVTAPTQPPAVSNDTSQAPPPPVASGLEADDPSIRPLLESAMHIQRGNIAAAVAELEKASQLSDNPKLGQALKMARRLLAEQQSV